MFSIESLEKGVLSGLVKHDPGAEGGLSPALVLNDKANGEKVLSYLLKNLEKCSTFKFAVAFVTAGGVACLHQGLKEATERGCTGEILISRYLNFSDPIAIRRLMQFSGITVRFVKTEDFHGKLYLFSTQSVDHVLLGSSNLTQAALGKNCEINISFATTNSSGLLLAINRQFEKWIAESPPVNEELLTEYQEIWERQRVSQEVYEVTPQDSPEINHLSTQRTITANSMQVEALENLSQVRARGESRTLIISATGTGKTVLSALDVKQFGASRLLFVVHRLNIARRALAEYQKVFGKSKTMGIYSGSDRGGLEADFVFATIQTINTDNHLERFDPATFDYIIIDESHHAGAATYQRILNYFKPKFLLGMTATPERSDGFNIYELFNHSVAYEIRLQQALDANLLAPFHYFGIADITVNGLIVEEKAQFNRLVSRTRVAHIMKAIDEYGCSNERPKGLVFCSSVAEAVELSQLFSSAGKPSIALSGSNSELDREAAILRLESTEGSQRLDYIFTVDIFNEGIDIPSVNQIIMLRPTESAIVFVQQLGRGLRKEVSKEYLTVLDFIGNYENNFLVPVALFGDASFNRDRLRRLMEAGSGLIPGESSISFDRISREQIFHSISKANVDSSKYLAQDYELLKFRLGHHPKMMDFWRLNQRDPYQYIASAGSMLAYRMKKDQTLRPEPELIRALEYLSKYVFDGIRAEESIILLMLLDQTPRVTFQTIKTELQRSLGLQSSDDEINSAIHSLNLNFVTELSGGKKIPVGVLRGYELVKIDADCLQPGKTLRDLSGSALIAPYLSDLAICSISKFRKAYTHADFNRGFIRGEKYSRRDVFRILQWEQNPNAQNVGGYIVNMGKLQCPIFVNYHKEESISETTKYEDHFEDASTLVYMSKNRRNLSSPDVVSIRNQKTNNLRIPIFIKKSNDEGLNFYYVGDGESDAQRFSETTMSVTGGASVSVVRMVFRLTTPLNESLYSYLTRPPSA